MSFYVASIYDGDDLDTQWIDCPVVQCNQESTDMYLNKTMATDGLLSDNSQGQYNMADSLQMIDTIGGIVSVICLLVALIIYWKFRIYERTALYLLPLLGFTSVLGLVEPELRPDMGWGWYSVWRYIVHSLRSFQGSIVAILCCFMNSEVVNAIHRAYFLHRTRRMTRNQRRRHISDDTTTDTQSASSTVPTLTTSFVRDETASPGPSYSDPWSHRKPDLPAKKWVTSKNVPKPCEAGGVPVPKPRTVKRVTIQPEATEIDVHVDVHSATPMQQRAERHVLEHRLRSLEAAEALMVDIANQSHRLPDTLRDFEMVYLNPSARSPPARSAPESDSP